MKILLVNSFFPTKQFPTIAGGAEKSVLLLAQAYKKSGNEVQAFAVSDFNAPEAVEEMDGITVHHGHIRNFFVNEDGKTRNQLARAIWHLRDDNGSAPARLKKAIEDFKPDIVHTNVLSGITTDVWEIAQRHGAKVVHTLRDYYLMCPRRALFKNNNICVDTCTDCKLFTRRRRLNTSKVDAVVGITKYILDRHLAEGLFKESQKHVIGNIVEVDGNQVAPKPSGTGPIRFGYIGRLGPEKGVDLLVESYGRTTTACSLAIAGKVTEADKQRFAGLCKKEIDYMGFVSPKDFYSKVDVVIVPSLWEEPLSRAVIDAVSAGRPVIGSRRGGIPEALGGDENGWLFDPKEPEALTKLMEMIALTRNLKEPVFKRTDILQKYTSLFESLVPAKAGK